MIASLNDVHKRTRGVKTRILLETTAGQGATVGWRFEQMRAIRDGLKQPERLGFCVDTCHVFAAGYDLSTKAGWARVFEEFDTVLGTDTIVAFHVNDSKKGLGCRVDRHENIGKGAIGLEAFRCLMSDPRFKKVPKVLETPKEDDMDIVNLRTLREMAR
jgi:deoxyribonuclease-4